MHERAGKVQLNGDPSAVREERTIMQGREISEGGD
jgi:hypothetical protein